jgi:hypothetical protein
MLQGRRGTRKQAALHERNLDVSFTSAGGVKSVAFRIGYDAKRLIVTGVDPGADLPNTARVTLTCVPTADSVEACVLITSDEEDLAGGTLNLASLAVRYLDEADENALRLVSVDVNGEDVNGAAPLRISIDGLSFDDDATGVDERDSAGEDGVRFHRQAKRDDSFDDLPNAAAHVRIPMMALAIDDARLGVTAEDDGHIAATIRIAAPDGVRSEAALADTKVGSEQLWKFLPQQREAETTGKIRIPAAALAKGGGVPGPRITIP